MRETLSQETVYVADSGLRCDHVLWAVVLGAAVGDLLLTGLGLSLCFTEANPVARAVLQAAGGTGLFGLKLTAVALLFAVYRYVRPLYGRTALVAFAIPQLLAVGNNGLLIARYAGTCP